MAYGLPRGGRWTNSQRQTYVLKDKAFEKIYTQNDRDLKMRIDRQKKNGRWTFQTRARTKNDRHFGSPWPANGTSRRRGMERSILTHGYIEILKKSWTRRFSPSRALCGSVLSDRRDNPRANNAETRINRRKGEGALRYGVAQIILGPRV